MGDSVRRIDYEYGDRHSTDRRSSFEHGTSPSKMLNPTVLSRMKESDEPAACAADSCDVGTLVDVAREASQGKIIGQCATLMLPGNNVVNLERHVVELLRHLAVFALLASALPDLNPQAPLHGYSSAAEWSSESRALDLRMPNRLLTRW
jgi:hypothetical protein